MSKSGNEKPSIAVLVDYGRAAVELNQYEEAMDDFRKALTIAPEIKVSRLVPMILINIVWLWEKEGNYREAMELAGAIRTHPTLTKQTADDLEIMIEEAIKVLSPEEVTEALKRGEGLSPDVVLDKILKM